MKKRIWMGMLLFGAALVAGSPTVGGDIDKLRAKGGFRDAKLGSRIEEFSNLVKVQPKSARHEDLSKRYTRPSDRLSVGPVTLNKIEYSFFQGRLETVSLDVQFQDCWLLEETLKAAYGEGNDTSLPKSVRSREWRADSIRVTHFVPLMEGAGPVCLVFFVDETIEKARRAAEEVEMEALKRRAREAAEDL